MDREFALSLQREMPAYYTLYMYNIESVLLTTAHHCMGAQTMFTYILAQHNVQQTKRKTRYRPYKYDRMHCTCIGMYVRCVAVGLCRITARNMADVRKCPISFEPLSYTFFHEGCGYTVCCYSLHKNRESQEQIYIAGKRSRGLKCADVWCEFTVWHITLD